MSLTKHSLAGNSQAGDRKIANLLLQCTCRKPTSTLFGFSGTILLQHLEHNVLYFLAVVHENQPYFQQAKSFDIHQDFKLVTIKNCGL
jgi:hypothetical protein